MDAGFIALGVIVTPVMVAILERGSSKRPAEGDWITPKSRREAALVLGSLAAFYAAFIFLALMPTSLQSGDGLPTAKAPFGLIAFVLFLGTFAVMAYLGRLASRRNPNPGRWDPFGSAAQFQIYRPTRLAEAGAILGLPKALVWGFLTLELTIAVSAFLLKLGA